MKTKDRILLELSAFDYLDYGSTYCYYEHYDQTYFFGDKDHRWSASKEDIANDDFLETNIQGLIFDLIMEER